MESYEKDLVIEELLKLVARLRIEKAGFSYENQALKEDVESLRKEVARLEALAAEKETAQAC